MDQKLWETTFTLGARSEKLLALRGDIDALTICFWREFGRGLGCEDPERSIAVQKERMRSIAYLGAIGVVISLSVPSCVFFLVNGNITEAVAVCVQHPVGGGA
jgi:hypothetical protein